ncbi:MAG: hpdA [Eubacterium sp.]|jgi:pyruvate formate lyase activating enzyme|nr:hpdA [Eubacterium sp.]
MMTGIVFKIQKYSIHDGPGIRTTVFLKGCPLNCWWCHNPEGQEPSGVIVYHEEKCHHCGRCIEICKDEAVYFKNKDLRWDRNKCTHCYNCIDVCPDNALESIGRKMTVSALMDIIEKDTIFYDESGGGVTFTGGEPFLQYEFLYEMLKSCKRKGIHTAIETSGYTAWDRMENIAGYTDLFLYDLKLMDEGKHIKYTGVSNKIILHNLKKLSEIHNNICVRIPVIPGVNDDEENIDRSIVFLKSTSIRNIGILPYHDIGIYKYDKLGIQYRLKGLITPEVHEMQKIADVFKNNGFCVKIGG